jgi:hypothetical protein
LILKGTCSALDKNPLRRFEVWTHEKKSVVLQNRCHRQRWLSWPLLRHHQSNSDVNVIGDHQKLLEEVHTFCLDLTLLILKVFKDANLINLKLPKEEDEW